MNLLGFKLAAGTFRKRAESFLCVFILSASFPSPTMANVFDSEVTEHLLECSKLNDVRLDAKVALLSSIAAATLARESGRVFKEIHFVRHGQGTHNAAAVSAGYGCTCSDPNDLRPCPYLAAALLDPGLTELGRSQASQLWPAVEAIGTVEAPLLVVVSPLSRAMETATIAFGQRPGSARFVADEDVREQNGQHFCDKHRPVRTLRDVFPHVSFDAVTVDDDTLWTPERESKQHMAERGIRFLKRIAQHPDTRLALVTHSSFLLTLFNAVFDTTTAPELRTWFETGEMRSVLVSFPE